MSPLVVHHLGPDPATVGGMATVIRILTEHRVGGDRVDCLPTWSPESGRATARLAAAAARRLLGLPAGQVAHVHLSERGSFVREGPLLMLARRRGLAAVATIHGASFLPFARRWPWLVSRVLRHADLVICLDQDVVAEVRRRAPGVRSEIVPNPVVVDPDPSSAGDTEELVVFAGEVGTRKGADFLSEAWRSISARRPAARCLMIGPAGDFAPSAERGLSVRPAVEPARMREVLRDARVVTLPSRAEGMPMILAEGMSLARPFVASRIGGVAELAEGGGGTLVEVGDVAALADEITRFLADPALAAAAGYRGRRFCLETRSVEVIDRRLRSLYLDAGAAE